MVSTSTFLFNQSNQSGSGTITDETCYVSRCALQLSRFHTVYTNFTWKYRETDQFHVCESFTSVSDDFIALSLCFTRSRVSLPENLYLCHFHSLSALKSLQCSPDTHFICVSFNFDQKRSKNEFFVRIRVCIWQWVFISKWNPAIPSLEKNNDSPY